MVFIHGRDASAPRAAKHVTGNTNHKGVFPQHLHLHLLTSPVRNRRRQFVSPHTTCQETVVSDKNAKLVRAANANLVRAAGEGDFEEVQTALTDGADVNGKTTDDGITTLIVATINGYTDIVKLLLDNGADVNGMENPGANWPPIPDDLRPRPGANRPPIPDQIGHLFRIKSAGHSDSNRPPF